MLGDQNRRMVNLQCTNDFRSLSLKRRNEFSSHGGTKVALPPILSISFLPNVKLSDERAWRGLCGSEHKP